MVYDDKLHKLGKKMKEASKIDTDKKRKRDGQNERVIKYNREIERKKGEINKIKQRERERKKIELKGKSFLLKLKL